ncbi:putative ribonuclease H-like domain-containing protein, partial [Tanacetum coccineum]
IEDNIDASDFKIEAESAQDYFVLPIWSSYTSTFKSSKANNAGEEPTKHPDLKPVDKEDQDLLLQAGADKASSTNIVNTASTPVSTASPYDGLSFTVLTNTEQDDSEIHALEDIYANPTDGIFTNSSYDDEGAVADFTNLEPVVNVVQNQRRNNHKDFQHCLFACFLSQNEPKKISEALEDETWVDAMQEELLQFKIQKVRILVDLPYGKKAIGTKWVYKIKKDERGVVVKNKARLVAQGHRAWYAPLSTFLQKNGYRRGTIDKTLFINNDKHDIILVQVYVDDIFFGSIKKSWCDEFKALMKSRFQMSSMGELTFFHGLQVKQKEDDIFISQDKYVAEILKKFDFVSIKTASTPIETKKPLVKDEEASVVDVHLYRSMIGSLMYLTASRPDIMYLKGKPKLGLWYPRVSSFDLEAYSDSDYAGANLDRKSTIGGCQFLGRRLISWQCKKQTIVATSTTEAEYVAAASCCGQVLWIQNQMLDYGFNFMNTKIYIDNESTICIVKNPVYHSKTKHIAIRHHFIRDAFEKKLIQVLKIHTDDNVADLLTKAFDVSRESLGRALDGSEALMLPNLFILWLAAVSTDSARYITAKVAGKPVSISEASIRSDLLFDDADGIDSLPNQAIFDAIQLMGHLDAKKKFVMYPRFISIFLDKQLMNVPVPLDHFPVNALTSKVFSFMVKKGKHFSRKVTPLFASMLVQRTKDDGATSERPSEAQPAPSPPHPSEENVEPQSDPSLRLSPFTHIPDSIPESSAGNQGGHSSSDKSLSGNEGDMTLQSVYDLCISLCTQVSDQAKEIQHLKAHIKKLKKQAKPGRKSAKAEPSVHKDPLFDEIPEDTLDYMETEDAQDDGRTRDVVNEEKENADDEVSTEDVLSTAQQKVSTDKEKVSTDRPKVSTDGSKVSTDKEKDSTDRTDEGTDDQTEGRRATQTTQTTTSTMFGDDETIAQVLLNMIQAKAVSREKEKGVELKDVEETERPRPTSTRSLLTLKPLPKIDPKDKGKKKIKEEDESETESEGILEAEKKFKQLVSDEEMARKLQEDWETEEERKRLAKEEATNDAFIRNYDDIKAKIEAERLQEEEREQFIVEERSKFLHDTIAAQRRFLAQQRSEAIRNKPPTKNQLRNQMMTYLKHVGNFQHSHLKTKKFEEIQALYEKIKRSDEDFIAIGSVEDEKMIKEMNEKGIDSSKNESVKEEGKEEEGTIDSEIMERKSVIARLNKVSSPDGDYLVIYRANGNFKAFNCLLEIMMESSTEENDQSDFWNDQQDWEIVTWRLYEAFGVYILELKDGTVIHMLVERRYPLSKDLLQRMLDLGLEVERESTAALDLIRLIKQ